MFQVWRCIRIYNCGIGAFGRSNISKSKRFNSANKCFLALWLFSSKAWPSSSLHLSGAYTHLEQGTAPHWALSAGHSPCYPPLSLKTASSVSTHQPPASRPMPTQTTWSPCGRDGPRPPSVVSPKMALVGHDINFSLTAWKFLVTSSENLPVCSQERRSGSLFSSTILFHLSLSFSF